MKEIRPIVWRRFQVSGDVSLHRLHLILQEVMGWTNSHLYRFEIWDTEYGKPDPDNEFNGLHFVDSHKSRLNKVVHREKDTFAYEYDFGDSWQHEIRVEKILPAALGVDYPVCLVGKQSCPPEDCGGIGGYAELLRIISDPAHDEYEGMMEWLGGSFDPEEFDLGQVNRALKRFRPCPKREGAHVPEVFRRAFESDDK